MSLRQSLAQGGPIVLGETTYTVSPLTQGVKGLFTSWCIEEAWKRAFASAEMVKPDQAARILELCAAQVNSGQYEFYAPLAVQVQSSFPGLLHLLWLRLRENHPKLTKAELEQVLTDNMEAVMIQLKALDTDPTPAKRIQE